MYITRRLRILFNSGICNELAEIYKVAQDSVPLPFPLKKPRNRGRENPSFVEEPETVRRSSSDVAIQVTWICLTL
jgi:hypothetical protein